MAPKKKAVVTTTRKVVQETVEVAVVDNNNEDIMQIARDELERKETIDSRGQTHEPVKSIIVEDKSPQTVQKTPAQDDSETQPPEKEPEQEEQTDTQETEEGHEDQAEEPTDKKIEEKKKKTGLNKHRKRRVRRGERERREEYKIYVFRVLKQVHPGMGISSKAMTVLNNLITDMFERLADEATRLSKYSGKTIMSAREIQGAVKLVLPGDLGKHAIAEGAKAISTFMSYDKTKS